MAKIGRIVPTKFSFTPDGGCVISETNAGFFNVHGLQTGKPQSISNASSVNVLTAMMILTLHFIAPEVTQFSVDVGDHEIPLSVNPMEDGWWRVTRNGTNTRQPFTVKEGNYLIKEGENEPKETLLILLGLGNGTDMLGLESVKHPLGVMEIETKIRRIEFKLKSTVNEAGKTETLQQGAVHWDAQS